MSLASQFMKKSKGYLNDCKKRNKFEDSDYKWELL